ncbi:ROK family protein [Kibdelosporangium aridum]|uniref:Sugar kinase of the NBD/HSP70 family, may contain an N-terminal HTH domain n=1 Tax=Kibdelosporangium aridum TaxID=2030 RepID=A0A1Y5XY78_KIBAR|nr:ROK family protein [Kibdelosporangium aridum]SMD18864.1 Sugar kinase of the NBD/HSP70 family, may contain an N-terminal HTH domain [Kibdelosporangium aridum]
MGGAIQAPKDTLGQLLLALHVSGGQASRAELTDRLGCGRSVMGYLLGELADRSLVRIDRTGGKPEGGRPSHQVAIPSEAPTVVAAQIQPDGFTVGTVGLGGKVLSRSTLPLRNPQPSEALDELCELMTSHVGPNVLGFGVAVPSPVRADGYAPAALHLGWPGLHLQELFEEHLTLPVAIANDANLAALAEHRHGAGRGSRQLLYLTTGNVGLGGGVVSEGRLFLGAHGYAIEPGHITVDPGGAPCPCGSTGCLEVEADHRALLRLLGIELPLREVAAKVESLMADPADDVLEAVHRVNTRLAIGLGSLANIVDADRIVLGGTLGKLYSLEPEIVRRKLAERAFLADLAHVPITPGERADSVLLGAAELAFQPLLDDPRAFAPG